MPDLRRLLSPRSVAVIGGGAWCDAVIAQLQRLAFDGAIWPVHPKRTVIGGLPAFPSVADLPESPDASFIGINRAATIDTVAALAARQAGGAVCFASGFAEVADGTDLNAGLLAAAGDMPILGPNCYGFVNALDRVALWPDQHGCVPVESGVAVLTQSSNLAINFTMQTRALPVGMVIACGNQAQTSQASIARALLADDRITAIGLHIEGFGDVVEWETLARAAHGAGKPLVALKVGRSPQARDAAQSHTASLAGESAASDALLARLGIAATRDPATFLETLKIMHIAGPLASNRIATISCSGGEASLAADLAQDLGLHFPPLAPGSRARLNQTLGPRVALGNPLDYHTYIWRDTDRMAATFAAMMHPDLAITLLIVDFPRADRCDPADWDCAVDAAIQARDLTGLPLAMVATLPENMPEPVASRLIAAGIVPLAGLDTALSAVAAAYIETAPDRDIPVSHADIRQGTLVDEHAAKTSLSAVGVPVPVGTTDPGQARELTPPFAVKRLGLAHKSDADGLRLNVTPDDLPDALEALGPDALIEVMATDGVAELLVGITPDPVCGWLLTVGAGGVLTELMEDTAHLLLPTNAASIDRALGTLRIDRLLRGYRGKPAADRQAVIAAILALQDYALANAHRLVELEINPLICTPDRAVAADALLRIADD